MNPLTHIDADGEARMVDVSAKPVQLREAIARGEIRLQKETLKLIEAQAIAKGNVLATARVAGIQAAKKCGELIPLCHPLSITHCEVTFVIRKAGIASLSRHRPKSRRGLAWKWRRSRPSASPR